MQASQDRSPARHPRLPLWVLAIFVAALPFCSSTFCAAQGFLLADLPAGSPFSEARAASSENPVSPSPEAPTSPWSGSLAGSVLDGSGALVPGAAVSLRGEGAAGESRARADEAGRFRFANLPGGTYVLTATAPGFQGFTSSLVALNTGEARDALELTMAVSSNHVVLEVRASRHDLANDEVHAEERQRVLGLFPNFYTSFLWEAQPLDSRQKFSLALHATTDSMAFVTAGLVAGGEQMGKTFPAYGYGPEGFAKRYGAAYADGFIGKMVGSALLPSVFRQDPRYFYLGNGTVRQRARHAILSAVIARGDNGRAEPNYSHILGNAATGAISTLYHPAADSAGRLALSNGLIGIVGSAVVNLSREFLLKPFTRGVPVYSKDLP